MTTTQRDACGYAGMALLSVLLLVWIIPVWSPPWPGYGMPPALVPSVAAWFILILACWGLARCARGLIRSKKAGCAPADAAVAEVARETGKKRPAWLHLLLFVVPCALLMPAMSLLGFVPAGVIFMLVIQWLCGQRRAVPLLLVAVLPVTALWALMRFALGVPMP